MLFHEPFPELAKQILRDLRRLRRTDLASQVMSLHIVDRCRCGSEVCGTFYTQQTESRKRMPGHGTDLLLECGAKVTEVDGRIVEIETLDPHVDETLHRVMP